MLTAAVVEFGSRVVHTPVRTVAAVPASSSSVTTSSTVDDVENTAVLALACVAGSKKGDGGENDGSDLHFELLEFVNL